MNKVSLVLLLLFVFFEMEGISSQNRVELERKRNNILKEITETENILNTIKQSKTESVEKLNLLDKKINLRNSLISNLSYEVIDVDKKINELDKVAESLTLDIKNIKAEYARMIYLAYLNRGQNNKLMFILASKDFNQAYKRISYLKQYSEYRQKQIAIINSFQRSLNYQISELEHKKKEKVSLLKSKESENEILKSEVNEKNILINSLKSKENNLEKKLRKQNELAEQLESEIEKAIKAELKAKAEAAAKALALAEKKNEKRINKKAVIPTIDSNIADISHEDELLSSNFRDNKGKLPWPIERGVISRGFGEYQDPVYKNVKHPSNGIDISTIAGAEARSVFDGEISSIFTFPGMNYIVLINHGKFFTLYQNLISVNVKKGDKVKTKQNIGKVFTDDNLKSTILHLEIWEEMKKLDPEIWLAHI
jgi:septal ring factor EnvC (AmiA/AmiB activator)